MEIQFFNSIFFWKKYFKDLSKIFIIELKETIYYYYLKSIILYPSACSLLLIIIFNTVLCAEGEGECDASEIVFSPFNYENTQTVKPKEWTWTDHFYGLLPVVTSGPVTMRLDGVSVNITWKQLLLILFFYHYSPVILDCIDSLDYFVMPGSLLFPVPVQGPVSEPVLIVSTDPFIQQVMTFQERIKEGFVDTTWFYERTDKNMIKNVEISEKLSEVLSEMSHSTKYKNIYKDLAFNYTSELRNALLQKSRMSPLILKESVQKSFFEYALILEIMGLWDNKRLSISLCFEFLYNLTQELKKDGIGFVTEELIYISNDITQLCTVFQLAGNHEANRQTMAIHPAISLVHHIELIENTLNGIYGNNYPTDLEYSLQSFKSYALRISDMILDGELSSYPHWR
jgi:hypothetical protein